ncbi:hypothetical protein C0075_05930 [Rhizobium sp. KAs_5_22]|uniref:hypothetical protein n=1 Tax=Ciceribacter selenitireducens TaxID=448181 RepID=UPI0004ADF647|nr:hypothetical protein [Ciceribacter selenitireducens]PPJ45300.1 hypothetical protein C0075_05930 [Rhizobium sp. KAs_5_22]
MVTRLARTGLVIAGTLSLVLNATWLNAGEYGHSPHSPDRGRQHQDAVVGGAGLPSVVPGIGTFAGSISAVRVRGSGIYFAIEGSRSDVIKYRPPAAKIIEIDAEMDDSACSYEAGVCVIRPQ